ncbi:hypothetical protein MKZ17_07795 [Solibacillus sp. FSL R7-0682]|uniref:hypothetical protein n=1 Tax=Solibacillus sp. FSL R7-0682 TaxID=2921690 RepID=UPI0030FB5EF2
MQKNIKILFDFKEIKKQFYPLLKKFDIHKEKDIRYLEEVLLSDLSKEDLLEMERTLEQKINSSSRNNTFLVTSISILITVFLGFITVTSGMSVDEKKEGLAILLLFITLVLIVGINVISNHIINNNRKMEDVLLLIRIIIFYKENKLIKQ